MLSDATLQTLDMKVNRQKVILFCHLSVIARCYLLLATLCVFTDLSYAHLCFLKVKVLYACNKQPFGVLQFLVSEDKRKPADKYLQCKCTVFYGILYAKCAF